MDLKEIKSMQKNVNCIKDIYRTSCSILQFQNDFEKIIPKQELSNQSWKEYEIQNMTIRLELIDNLFYVNCIRTEDGYEDYLLARQIIDDDVPIYFELFAFTDSQNSFRRGKILYSKSPKLFIENCSLNICSKERLYKFLEQSYAKEKHQCPNCEESHIFN